MRRLASKLAEWWKTATVAEETPAETALDPRVYTRVSIVSDAHASVQKLALLHILGGVVVECYGMVGELGNMLAGIRMSAPDSPAVNAFFNQTCEIKRDSDIAADIAFQISFVLLAVATTYYAVTELLLWKGRGEKLIGKMHQEKEAFQDSVDATGAALFVSKGDPAYIGLSVTVAITPFYLQRFGVPAQAPRTLCNKLLQAERTARNLTKLTGGMILQLFYLPSIFAGFMLLVTTQIMTANVDYRIAEGQLDWDSADTRKEVAAHMNLVGNQVYLITMIMATCVNAVIPERVYQHSRVAVETLVIYSYAVAYPNSLHACAQKQFSIAATSAIFITAGAPAAMAFFRKRNTAQHEMQLQQDQDNAAGIDPAMLDKGLKSLVAKLRSCQCTLLKRPQHLEVALLPTDDLESTAANAAG